MGSFQTGVPELAGLHFNEGQGRCASGQVRNHRTAKSPWLPRIFHRVRRHVSAGLGKRLLLGRSRGCPGEIAGSGAEPADGNFSAPMATGGVFDILEEDTAISRWAGLLDQRGELDWRPGGPASWISDGEIVALNSGGCCSTRRAVQPRPRCLRAPSPVKPDTTPAAATIIRVAVIAGCRVTVAVFFKRSIRIHFQKMNCYAKHPRTSCFPGTIFAR